MADSLIADLLKTPGQVRREQLDRLNKQGATSAQTMLTGARFGSPIGGALQSLAGVGMEMMPAMTSQMFRGATGLLGGIAGAAGASPEVVQALEQAQYSPEERQAAEIQRFSKEELSKYGGLSTNPNALRLLSGKLMQMGQPDAAMKVEEQASKIEELQAKALKTKMELGGKYKAPTQVELDFARGLLNEAFKSRGIDREYTESDLAKFLEGYRKKGNIEDGFEEVLPKSDVSASKKGVDKDKEVKESSPELIPLEMQDERIAP